MNTEKPKFVAFVVFVCTTASFIAQISSLGNVSRRHAPSWIAKGIPSYGSQSKRAISGGWVANQSARKTRTTVLLEWFSPFVTRRERVKSATQSFLVSSRNAPPVGRKKWGHVTRHVQKSFGQKWAHFFLFPYFCISFMILRPLGMSFLRLAMSKFF